MRYLQDPYECVRVRSLINYYLSLCAFECVAVYLFQVVVAVLGMAVICVVLDGKILTVQYLYFETRLILDK